MLWERHEDLQKGFLWGKLRMQKFENEYTFLLSLSLKLQMVLGHGGRVVILTTNSLVA